MEITEELYQELVLDHFKNPRCGEPVDNPEVSHVALNPLCGDRVALSVKTDGGIISHVSFKGSGCCISQAAASMLTELCRGKTVTEAQQILNSYRQMMLGEKDADDVPELHEVRALIGVRKYAARMRCALLGCDALDHCIKQCHSHSGMCDHANDCPSASSCGSVQTINPAERKLPQ
jgi:nitrogen fixation NifU-like protein